ncbi:acetyl-CoA carboxylase biotin carboxyl carrier protein [Terribacillus saccharophilus]|uniref:acetyl-CoA carboxylase biotin carboxyl carrier protein n=1 Tax=Terribacillus saccharophilus TaxID=361277 RepID=UPI00298A0611|nr:acetyl-CoA carboxylase biotin carboxyl carrier protein [Terribacillus saccharophilus]MCM3224530.1 acetyl-CoA carboxylase biotin carboxyl carrier protein [Terribacillus saccharophilus]
MLKLEELKELITLIDQSSIDEFDYETEGEKVSLRKNKEVVQVAATPAPVQPAVSAPQAPVSAAQPEPAAQAPEAAAKNYDYEITSLMVGTFYSKPNPDSDDFVSIGERVEKDTVVCIVEAMKLFNEITADVTGEIVEVLVENGELVEYGQPLFRVKAN